MKDLLIIPNTPGTVTFEVRGKSEDSGLLLLQRLYVLLFSGSSEDYRTEGGNLSGFLEGVNIPDIGSFNALLAVFVGLCGGVWLGFGGKLRPREEPKCT